MAVKGPSPSTPAHPDLTRAQITALETYGSKATRNALLSTSQPALTNPLISCLICIHPYHSANVEGNTETPVITACGHIFGNKCIKQWLEEENGTSGTKNEKTCPMCRFSLKYRECGCVIQAVPAFDPPPPPTITASQIPRRCGKHEIRRVLHVKKARYDDLSFELYDEKTALAARRDASRQEGAQVVDGEKVLLTQRQMEESFPEAWATFVLAERELEDVVRRLGELTKEWKGLQQRTMEEIRGRGGWYL